MNKTTASLDELNADEVHSLAKALAASSDSTDEEDMAMFITEAVASCMTHEQWKLILNAWDKRNNDGDMEHDAEEEFMDVVRRQLGY